MGRNGYIPSILQDERDIGCYLCGRADQHLDRHEVFHGPYRQKSKRLGLWVSLCHFRCHLCGVHENRELDMKLKEEAQKAAMEVYDWTVADFIKEFGRNYVDVESD